MRQTQKSASDPDLMDFGLWVKEKLVSAEVSIADLGRQTGITYPSLNNMLNSGNRGKPTRQDAATVTTIANALRTLGVIEDNREAFVAAGFLAKGYKVVREEEASVSYLRESEREFDENEVVKFYKGQPIDVKKRLAMRLLFDEQDREDNEGTIGGTRAE